MVRALLEDGSLALHAHAELWRWVAPWVPQVPPAADDGPRALIRVERGEPDFDVPTRRAEIEVGTLAGWVDSRRRVLLCEPRRRLSAVVDPAAGHATVRLADGDEPTPAGQAEIMAGLTLAAAFLLGRLSRTLVHAGAVVAPDGGAWLLVGGSFSGKSTTCLNLIRRGWDYLADDHVVLGHEPGTVSVEGWPRKFNLDLGYEGGVSRGVRNRVDASAWGPGRWRRSAPLAGLLFPRVEAGSPTTLERIRGAAALSALLRQSPWLIADPGTAAGVLRLLEKAAESPAFELRLGNDCYTNGEQLLAVLQPALAREHFA